MNITDYSNAVFIPCEYVPPNTTSLCRTFVILQSQEKIYIFILGLLAGVILFSLIFMLVRMFIKYKGKED